MSDVVWERQGRDGASLQSFISLCLGVGYPAYTTVGKVWGTVRILQMTSPTQSASCIVYPGMRSSTGRKYRTLMTQRVRIEPGIRRRCRCRWLRRCRCNDYKSGENKYPPVRTDTMPCVLETWSRKEGLRAYSMGASHILHHICCKVAAAPSRGQKSNHHDFRPQRPTQCARNQVIYSLLARKRGTWDHDGASGSLVQKGRWRTLVEL